MPIRFTRLYGVQWLFMFAENIDGLRVSSNADTGKCCTKLPSPEKQLCQEPALQNRSYCERGTTERFDRLFPVRMPTFCDKGYASQMISP